MEDTLNEATFQDLSSKLKSAVDAEWGGDVQHRRSITGFVLKLAGGAIYYKSCIELHRSRIFSSL